MTEVKYTIRGSELFDINPEFQSDLERVTCKLFDARVSFPDFTAYEESIVLMHGVIENDSVQPESPWAKARFRFDEKTRIDSLQGILIKTSENEETYIYLSENIPKIAANAKKHPYDANLTRRFSDQHSRGKSVEKMIIDRGKEYDTVTLSLNNKTEMVFLYRQGTFIGFEIDESTGHGIKSTHYILEDVDPSIYVAGFLESAKEGKDVLFNEGLMGGAVKPLLVGATVQYKEPDKEKVEIVKADNGDQYTILFEAESLEEAQKVYSRFRKSFEDESRAGSEMPFSVDTLVEHLGPKTSVGMFPRFAVDLKKDRKINSKTYGLTLTTISTGCFETRNDLKSFLQGSIMYIKSEVKIDSLELL